MRTKSFTLLAGAVLLLAPSCYHERHECPPSGPGGSPSGYLTPLLLWEDAADAASPVDDIRFIVGSAGGPSVTRSFDSASSAAEWLQLLPAGGYDLLVTVDMDESHGYVLENVGADTRADEELHTALPDTRVSLSDPSSSPRQSWYAVTHATVKEDEVTVAEFRLQRLLSEVSVIVRNVPPGTSVTASVERVAVSVLLTRRDGQGRHGVADSEDYLTVGLGSLAADPSDGSVLRLDGHTLMPTAGGQERCYLMFSVTASDGTPLTYLADAPRMECGKAYVVDLDYTQFRPYMLLNAFTINDWTEGWTISGEIINPDE